MAGGQVLGVEHSLLVKRATVVLKARVARAAELLASVGFVLVHDLSKNLQARSPVSCGKGSSELSGAEALRMSPSSRVANIMLDLLIRHVHAKSLTWLDEQTMS